ncbi:MAG: hypothetical protein ABI207_03275, partial [Crocinitomicaceae bacterium]
MSKVVTFCTKFPSYHPKKSERTFFVEKIWKGLWDLEKGRHIPFDWRPYDEAFPCTFDNGEDIHTHKPKWHTIRIGDKRKVGNYFSPRVWGNDINPKSGRKGAYHSKQITFAPDLEIKYCPSIEIYKTSEIIIAGKFYSCFGTSKSNELALNDG